MHKAITSTILWFVRNCLLRKIQFDAAIVNSNKYARCLSSIDLILSINLMNRNLFSATTRKNGDARPFGI